MFCPICEAEYEAGIERCADDGAALVARLTRENVPHDRDDVRLVPLHNFSTTTEAEMVGDLLMQNGIRAGVQSGGADPFAAFLSTLSMGAIVLVEESDYDRAVELYRTFFGEDTTPLTGTTIEEDEAAGGQAR